MSPLRLSRILASLAVLVAVGALVLFSLPALRAVFARGLPSPTVGQLAPQVDAGTATRLAVAGDTGTGKPAQLATARRMELEHQKRPYDGMLLLGDLVYEKGEVERVDDVVLDPFAPVLDTGVELFPVLGNHDYGGGEQRQIMAALGRERRWYVDRMGSVRIIVLDSNRISDRQTQWLREKLAAPQPPDRWTLVALHHPPYSAGYHGSDLRVRRLWAPLFRRYDVPLVLAGHEHDYQRTKRIDGVTYVISGAGAKVRPTGRSSFTAVSSATFHYLDLLVRDDRIVGRAIDHDGRLVDSFTLQR